MAAMSAKKIGDLIEAGKVPGTRPFWHDEGRAVGDLPELRGSARRTGSPQGRLGIFYLNRIAYGLRHFAA